MIQKISMSAPVKKFFFWLLLVAIISLGFCYGSFNAGCSSSEREALLKFKQDLTDPSNRLASWIGDGDCCGWSGVLCDNSTGNILELHLRTLSFEEYSIAHSATGFGVLDFLSNYEAYQSYRMSTAFGGKVNPSLLNLKHLRYLDLSNNNFGGIHIPKFLGSMLSLRYLNLSSAGFGGMIPHQLGNLSNLHYLDLNNYNYYYNGDAGNLHWLSGLSSLEFLDLTYVNLNKASNWLEVMNTLSSLKELYLRDCGLPHIPPLLNVNFSSLSILDLSENFLGESLVHSWLFRLKTLNSLNLRFNNFQGLIPNDLQNMTSLRKLNLSYNYFNSSIPNWLYGFSRLEFLDLSSNELQGKISSVIGNMTSLVDLRLSSNKKLEFERGISRSFKNLCNLKSLELSGVKLSQSIGEMFKILLGCVSHGLESLSLSSCQLYGHLTSHISQFKNLAFLDVQNNLISGPIPMSLGELMSLISLDLSNNKLNGSFPISFGGLTKLQYVDISSNSLEGDVSESHFANLTKLRAFDASGNQLRLTVSPDWIPPLQLESLELGSWHIGHQIPKWLRSLKHLSYLDLSNSGISGTIPIWFRNLSFKFQRLNLSHNKIHGEIPNVFEDASLDSWIDLSSNQFKGPLPYISLNVTLLDLSNNSFLGSMSEFLCYEVKQMAALNLEGNLLFGEMPNCWMNWPNLQVIILSNNNLIGNIPESIGNLSLLRSLHLHNNHLFGEIPLSLQNCTFLSILDLGENELEGNIPTWVGERFSQMIILNFRSNKFHGSMPKELCHLDSLQILDLADNSLFGTIPSCVSNFSAMSTKIQSEGQISYYTNSFLEDMALVMKGEMMEYNTILNFVRVVDLSNNQLFGEIPKELTSLHQLQSLNLSQNNLTGRIPEDIGGMQFLESIDFSQNQLSGEIPQSMSSLTFLSHLNLSNNKLSGKIPLGTQLQGLDPSSFTGNQLCGRPLIKNCNVDGVIPSIENGRRKDGDGVEIDWFYVSMAPGFVVGFWSVLGPLLFNRRWRHAYFRFLDNLGYKIWWLFM